MRRYRAARLGVVGDYDRLMGKDLILISVASRSAFGSIAASRPRRTRHEPAQPLALLKERRADFNAQSYSGRLKGGYRFATPFLAFAPYAAIQAQSRLEQVSHVRVGELGGA